MRIVDVTLVVRQGMPVYQGDPPLWTHTCIAPVAGNADSYGVTVVTLGSHLGTHVDAPRHFVAGGPSVTDLDLAVLCGPCRVLDLTDAGLEIDDVVLSGCALGEVERLLFKTSNGALLGSPFTPRYAHVTRSGAEYLRRRTRAKLVGIDYLSIEAFDSPGFPVHHALLDGPEPVVIVEGLDLRAVQPGDYELFCLPLPLEGSDGAPARVVLVSRSA